MRTRSVSKIIRLTPKENEHLKKQSEITGLTGEALIRSLIMGIDIQPIPPDQINEALRQLSAIGNNINQIARVANMTRTVDMDDIAALKSLQATLNISARAFNSKSDTGRLCPRTRVTSACGRE